MSSREAGIISRHGRNMEQPEAPGKAPRGISYDRIFEFPEMPAEEMVEPKSFRNNIIKMLCYTAVVPIFMLGLFQSQQFQRAMASADQAQLGMAQSIAESVRVTVVAAERVQQVFADAEGFSGGSPARARAAAERFVENRNRSTLSAMALFDAGGSLIAGAEREGAVPLSEALPKLRESAMKSRGAGASVDILRLPGRSPLIAVSVRQKGGAGGVSAAVYTSEFLDETVSRVLSGAKFDSVVADSEGFPIGGSREEGADGVNRALEGLSDADAALREKPEGALIRTPGTRDVSQIKAYARIQDLGWTVALSQPVRVRDQIMLASIETSGFFFLVALILTVVIGIVMNRPLTRSVSSLMDSVEAFGRTGKLRSVKEKLEKDGISELVALGESFERMAGQVTDSKRKLERLNAGLEKKVAERTYTLLSRNSELRALQRLLMPLQDGAENRWEAVRAHAEGCIDQFRLLLGLSELAFVSSEDEPGAPASGSRVPVEFSGRVYGWLIPGADAVLTPDRVDSLRRLANSLGIVLANARLVEQLAKEHATLSAVFESMTDGVVILGRSGRIIYANEFACRLLNDGKPLLGLYGRPHVERLYNQAIPDEAQTRHTRIVRRTAGGVTQTVDVTGFIVTDLPGFPGERRGWLLRDISKEAGIDAMKENLVSVVAHELKTPVTALRLLAETVKHDADAGKKVEPEDMEALLDDTMRLGQLIDDLLDVSRIEGGAMKLEKRVVQVASLIDRAARLARSRCPIRVEREIDPEAEVICADPPRVTQVFINLFVNAARYRKADQDEALCRVTVRPGEDRTVVIRVRDEGRGIEPERLARVFEPFYQADMSWKRTGKGAGLGLTIVKGITEAHRGEVSVKSELGSFTEFTIIIPA